MGYALPLAGSDARDMFDIGDLVAISIGKRVPVPFPEARAQAKRYLADAGAAVVRVVYIVLRANDDLELVSFGRRGGAKVEWRFGPYQIPKVPAYAR